MTNQLTSLWPLLITLIFCFLTSCNGVSAYASDQKLYIVYMGDRPKSESLATAAHMSMLQVTIGSKRATESWLYSYKRSFNGFVAKLTEEEKNKISGLEGVVSVFESTKNQLHTTRSWDFMGFPLTTQRTTIESNITIGMLDTGIWPESASFNDTGFGSLPTKWKGTCQSSSNFTCNNKIIGAKYYHSEGKITAPDIPSPRDTNGHGSHTSSIAAGSVVYGASMDGIGSGTARGAMPSSRIAVYKICWSDGCTDADILAAFDDAIADGVDIISLSVGGPFPRDYFNDPIAIGAFHAMKNGILTSNSAGNSGPDPWSVRNYSPWSISVAASIIDRKIFTKLLLGNKIGYQGNTINTFGLDGSYPLVYGGDVPNTAKGFDSTQSGNCDTGSLDPELVKGKIVLCDGLNDGGEAADAGAIGTIMNDDYNFDSAFSYPLAATYLRTRDGDEVHSYINQTSNPNATIFKSAEKIETQAPFVVSFSSRGPNPITLDILKPDITAPGVDIVAAWSEGTSPTGMPEDKRVLPYNIISGTSMSCPHVSGAAAYVKSFNPTWSPSAIKSALMTTAYVMSSEKNRDAEMAYGSGHINPVRAKSPGLIYDMGEAEYVSFLCGLGYNNTKLQLITRDNSTCTKSNTVPVANLNYPSLLISSPIGTSAEGTFQRTVTNVGSPKSTYKAVVEAPSGLDIQVVPNTLSFTSLGQKISFAVTVSSTVGGNQGLLSGSLIWGDGVYEVRSPVLAYFYEP